MVEVELNNEETPSKQLDQISDPNLTLISIFSSVDGSPLMSNVRRASSSGANRSSQLISLFSVPNRSVSNGKSSTRSVENLNERKLSSSKKLIKVKRRTRFVSFFRSIFCQFSGVVPNATVTPIQNEQENPAEQIEPKEEVRRKFLFCCSKIFLLSFRKRTFCRDKLRTGAKSRKRCCRRPSKTFEIFRATKNFSNVRCFPKNFSTISIKKFRF